ncbi:MAG: LamG-like jellyroll fold domain-containing protein [Planctomycetota bacterium]
MFRRPRPASVRWLIPVVALGSLLLPLAAPGQTPAQLPIENGDLVTTHFGGFNNPSAPAQGLRLGGPVTTLVDVRIPPLAGNPIPTVGTNWPAPMFSNIGAGPDEWVTLNLGQVFGLALDDQPQPNIYVAATTAYGDFSSFAGAYGPGGPGGVYRLDGNTGTISSLTVTGPGGIGTNQIPNGRAGLGNLAYDRANAQFFVANLEDGRIYRLDAAGIILSTFDPFAPTVAVPNLHAPLGERPYAVEVFNQRVYFSVWLRDSGRPGTAWPVGAGPAPLLPNNTIWSIALDGTGDFLGAPQLEIVLPYLPAAQFSNPVTDISFTAGGALLAAERTFIADFGMIDVGHTARVLEFVLSGPSWVASPQNYYVGSAGSPPHNAAGGVDPDCASNVWASGDVLLSGTYGLQRIPVGGNTIPTATSTSYLVDFPGQLKAGQGDVEVYTDDCGCLPPRDVLCEVDADGTLLLTWTLPGPFDEIHVVCDGVTIAILPGNATSYTPIGLPPNACCQVVGVLQIAGAPPVFCPSELCCTGPCQPPQNVTCVQDPVLAAILLNWTNPQSYDEIHVVCNGVTVAVLVGNATSHALPIPNPPTLTCCQVVGVIIIDPAIPPTLCPSQECCVGPCMPPQNLTCTEDPAAAALFLNWTNPQIYDEIHVICNGVTVAILTGTATSHTAPLPTPPIPTCCQVVGVINGPAGTPPTMCPSTDCCTGCQAPTNLECTLDAAGGILLTWSNPMAYSQINITCNGVLIASLAGNATSFPLPQAAGYNCCQVSGLVPDATGLLTECFSLECCYGCDAPTSVSCIQDDTGTITLNWLNPGVYDQIHVYCGGVLVATLPGTATTYSHLAASGQTTCCIIAGVVVDATGVGIECAAAECCAGCAPPFDVTCELGPLAGSILISWTNGQLYDSITVYCDGVPVASLVGGATSYLHTGVPAGATVCYVVVGELVHDPATPPLQCSSAECCVTIPGGSGCPPTDLVVLLNTGWDANSGLIADGNPDDEWMVVGDRDPANNAVVLPFGATPEPAPAEVRPAHAAWGGPLVGPGATGSKWIYHSINTANGFFDYEFCFCLREGFQNAVLSLDLLADDRADVYLNGNLIASTLGSAFLLPPDSVVETDQTLFHPGENCLRVTVQNTHGVVTGLNLVGQVTADYGECCCTPPPFGMVGWWPLDEDPGTFTQVTPDIASDADGLVTLPDFVPGKVANALHFDGVASEVIVPDEPQLDFGAPVGFLAGDLSIDAWVRLDDNIAGAHPIVSKFAAGGASPGYALFVDSAGYLGFVVQDSSTRGLWVPSSGGAFINDGQWHHVAVTYDRDHAPNGVRLYVDGMRVDPDTYQGTAFGSLTNTAPLRIGASTMAVAGTFFEGDIDEVEIFDRVLLAGEVRDLFAAGSYGKCKEYCHVPWDQPVASNGVVTVNTQICNDGPIPQTYTVSAMPTSTCSLPGPVSIAHPATVVVPAGGCVTVPVTLTAPTGPGISCYTVCFENQDTGHKLCCDGSISVGRRIIIGVPIDVIMVGVGTISDVPIVVTNPGPGPISTSLRVDAMTMGRKRRVISLDGLPPGEPVIASLDLAEGESTTLSLPVSATGHEPFSFFDVIVSVDDDGDGVLEALHSGVVRSAPALTLPEPTFRRGDCNQDGQLNIGDTIYALSYLFSGGTDPGCPDACDANDDGQINIGDPIFELSYLFSAGPPPPAPGSACGVDPTADSLTECLGPACN